MKNLLNNISNPEDLRKLNPTQLPQLAKELRDFIIDILATKEGHLGASLGVIELTIALHYLFDTLLSTSQRIAFTFPTSFIKNTRLLPKSPTEGGGQSIFTCFVGCSHAGARGVSPLGPGPNSPHHRYGQWGGAALDLL